MLNNEFRLIGVVLTDFIDISANDKYKKYKIEIEVNKKWGGRATVYEIVILGTNQSVNVSKSLKGKLVIANGYVDCYNKFISLIAQELFVVVDTESDPFEEAVNPSKGLFSDVEKDENDDLPF